MTQKARVVNVWVLAVLRFRKKPRFVKTLSEFNKFRKLDFFEQLGSISKLSARR